MHDYLTQHWKTKPANKLGLKPPGVDVRTLQNDILVCNVHNEKLAAHIVKTHNEFLIHPDKLIRSVQHLLPAMDCHLGFIPPEVSRLMDEVRTNLEEV